MLHCCITAWALTPRFHPYPGKPGRYIFCGTGCSRGVQPQDLPVRKYGALCCPDFPYPRTCRDTIEQVVTTAKVRKIWFAGFPFLTTCCTGLPLLRCNTYYEKD